MKKFTLVLMTLLLTVSCTSAENAQAGDKMGSNSQMALEAESLIKNINELPVYDLTPEEIDGLKFMWEEEKLARDVYITFSQMYNARIFSNISRSEQKHMDAVKQLIAKYNIPLIGSNEVGVFITEEFQNLYDSLVSRGTGSLKAALEVGRDIELLDINDLESRMNGTAEDIELVYSKLLKASYNHLNAFERNLARQ